MIYVEPRAGLSNRMRVIASAYCLAQKYNTNVTILWRLSNGLNAHFFSLFKPVNGVRVLETQSKLSIKCIFYILSTHRYYKNISMISKMTKMENDLMNGKDIYICTVHQFYDVDHYNMFIPVDDIEKSANEKMKNNREGVIGIHIRRTDNVASIISSPLELFEEKIEEEIRQNAESCFYLATDDKQVESDLTEKYNGRIIKSENKTFGRDTEEGIRDALIDLRCLSKCKKIYGSFYSSFSETAALWGNKKLEIIKIDEKWKEMKNT